MSPYRSKKQHRYFRYLESKGAIPKGTASRWAHETEDMKALPEQKKEAWWLFADTIKNGSVLNPLTSAERERVHKDIIKAIYNNAAFTKAIDKEWAKYGPEYTKRKLLYDTGANKLEPFNRDNYLQLARNEVPAQYIQDFEEAHNDAPNFLNELAPDERSQFLNYYASKDFDNHLTKFFGKQYKPEKIFPEQNKKATVLTPYLEQAISNPNSATALNLLNMAYNIKLENENRYRRDLEEEIDSLPVKKKRRKFAEFSVVGAGLQKLADPQKPGWIQSGIDTVKGWGSNIRNKAVDTLYQNDPQLVALNKQFDGLNATPTEMEQFNPYLPKGGWKEVMGYAPMKQGEWYNGMSSNLTPEFKARWDKYVVEPSRQKAMANFGKGLIGGLGTIGLGGYGLYKAFNNPAEMKQHQQPRKTTTQPVYSSVNQNLGLSENGVPYDTENMYQRQY